ncbi:MAG: FtsX-like permease family protein [Pseudomonadota bacterium]
MKLRDFRIGWRLLAKEPAYTAVVVAGLALGFAACFLLLGFVRYSFSYDSTVPDNRRVYVMQHKVNVIPTPTWIEFMPLAFRQAALTSGMASQVSAAIPVMAVFETDGRKLREEVTIVDPVFPAMFGIEPLEGDLRAALARPDGLALTRHTARALFGDAAALGRRVTIDGRAYRVMALLDDAPANTTMPYRVLAGSASALWPADQRGAAPTQWMGLGGKVYLRLAADASPAALTTALQAALDRSPWSQMVPPEELPRIGHVAEVRLRSLSEAYFDSEVAGGFRGGVRGNRTAVIALGLIAILILALAATNYVNLATVRTLRREREIGVRKLIGASRASLVGLFAAESMLVALVAGLLGLLLAWLLLPLFAQLVDRPLHGLLTPLRAGAALLLALLIGAASSLYPAAIALRMRPVDALATRGNGDNVRGLWLRRALSVLQFAVATALSGATLAIGWQTSFAGRADPGFDSAGLSVLTLPRDSAAPARRALRAQIERLPGVAAVAVSGNPIGAPGIMKGSTGVKSEGGVAFVVKLQEVSSNFFTVFKVAPLAGRLFDPAIDTAPPESTRVTIANMAAVRALGYASPQEAIGKRIDGGYWTIIGVAPDVRDQSLREPIQPTLYRVDEGQFALSVRSALPPAELHALVEPLWMRQFPGHPLELRSAHSYYAENYADDLRLSRLLGAASVLAIAIAAFGIYVLAAFNVQRRGREIVLRKLHGAGRAAIARLVGREFAMLVGLGAAVGLPLAALATERYLSGFAERAPMGAWPLAGALALAALIALAATARHTLMAMRLSPAAALRD